MVSIKVHDRVEEQPHSLTLALDGDTGPASYPGHFTTGQTAFQPLNRRLDGPQNHSGDLKEEKVSCFC